MRTTHSVLMIGAMFAVIALAGGVEGEPTKAEAAKLRIVPVIVLKPGEQKELCLATTCTVGTTRGGGFRVTEMKAGVPFEASSKAWKRDGLTVEVPTFDDGEKHAALPLYEPLKKKSINAFMVKITAAADAKPGAFSFHLVDATCNGHCESDFHVLIATP